MGFYNDYDSEIEEINITIKKLRTDINDLLDKSERYYGCEKEPFISKFEEMQILICKLNSLSRSLNDM